MVKFSSKIDEEVLEQLRAYTKERGLTMAAVLTTAVKEHLARAGVRPAFTDAASKVMNDHAELLERLAK